MKTKPTQMRTMLIAGVMIIASDLPVRVVLLTDPCICQFPACILAATNARHAFNDAIDWRTIWFEFN